MKPIEIEANYKQFFYSILLIQLFATLHTTKSTHTQYEKCNTPHPFFYIGLYYILFFLCCCCCCIFFNTQKFSNKKSSSDNNSDSWRVDLVQFSTLTIFWYNTICNTLLHFLVLVSYLL